MSIYKHFTTKAVQMFQEGPINKSYTFYVHSMMIYGVQSLVFNKTVLIMVIFAYKDWCIPTHWTCVSLPLFPCFDCPKRFSFSLGRTSNYLRSIFIRAQHAIFRVWLPTFFLISRVLKRRNSALYKMSSHLEMILIPKKRYPVKLKGEINRKRRSFIIYFKYARQLAVGIFTIVPYTKSTIFLTFRVLFCLSWHFVC